MCVAFMRCVYALRVCLLRLRGMFLSFTRNVSFVYALCLLRLRVMFVAFTRYVCSVYALCLLRLRVTFNTCIHVMQCFDRCLYVTCVYAKQTRNQNVLHLPFL